MFMYVLTLKYVNHVNPLFCYLSYFQPKTLRQFVVDITLFYLFVIYKFAFSIWYLAFLAFGDIINLNLCIRLALTAIILLMILLLLLCLIYHTLEKHR